MRSVRHLYQNLPRYQTVQEKTFEYDYIYKLLGFLSFTLTSQLVMTVHRTIYLKRKQGDFSLTSHTLDLLILGLV